MIGIAFSLSQPFRQKCTYFCQGWFQAVEEGGQPYFQCYFACPKSNHALTTAFTCKLHLLHSFHRKMKCVKFFFYKNLVNVIQCLPIANYTLSWKTLHTVTNSVTYIWIMHDRFIPYSFNTWENSTYGIQCYSYGSDETYVVLRPLCISKIRKQMEVDFNSEFQMPSWNGNRWWNSSFRNNLCLWFGKDTQTQKMFISNVELYHSVLWNHNCQWKFRLLWNNNEDFCF